MAHKAWAAGSRKISIRDSTLREGLDVPGVGFSTEQRLRIAKLLDRSNVPEIEIVAPGRVFKDLEFAGKLKSGKPPDQGFRPGFCLKPPLPGGNRGRQGMPGRI